MEQMESTTVHPATPGDLNTKSDEAGDKEFDSTKKAAEMSPVKSKLLWRSENLPAILQWIPANWTWSKWKPVLRSALSAWISLLLFLIPTTMDVMGQVSFFSFLLLLARSEERPGSFSDHHR